MSESSAERVLRAFLLGAVDFNALLALQRRLMYEVGGEAGSGTIILCDHPSGITIGREGSRLHVRPSPEELALRDWPIRWVGRGGGVVLHLPGQVTCYPVFALERMDLTPAAFVATLQDVVVELLREFGIVGTVGSGYPGVRIRDRLVAHVGIAVRGGISCFGLVINVVPDLDPFRDVYCDGEREPMTSIQREAPTLRVRIAAVRQRLVELFAARFRFDRVTLFHTRLEPQKPTFIHAAPTTAR